MIMARNAMRQVYDALDYEKYEVARGLPTYAHEIQKVRESSKR